MPTTGQHWWVDPNAALHTPKYAFGHGRSQDYPLSTLAAAEAASQTGDVIMIHGNIREENVVFSNLKFDRKVVGIGGLHHPDQPSSAYHPGSSMIRPPASPTATTPLIVSRGRGLEFHNVTFDAPVDAAAVQMNANALSDVSEYDASHAKYVNCLFQAGYRGIQDVGGCINTLVKDSQFRTFSETGGAAIVSTSTSVRLPQYWLIEGCIFPGNGASGGNETHIDTPLSGSVIRHNVFGTVEGTALYIDLTGGDDNDVCYNSLAGVYNTSDYVAGTSDRWFGNNVAVISTQAPNGFTITVPAAP